MEIVITKEAKQFLEKNKSNSIAVVFQGCGKCNSPSRQASVGMVVPRDLERYQSYTVDGVDVYVRDDVSKHKDNLVVSLSKRLFSKELVAD